ncbi:MAG: NVEALA domain-containing protein [Parabacteroides gordonii]|nr:NVEALA domain-containing protein [Parabacteroides gordonii]
MKKKILGVAIIAAIAVTAGWNFNQSKNEINLSDLAIANVEALASGEVSPTNCPGGTILCAWITGNGSVTYYKRS